MPATKLLRERTIEEGRESAAGEEGVRGAPQAPAGAERGGVAPPAGKGGGACRPRAAPGLRRGCRDQTRGAPEKGPPVMLLAPAGAPHVPAKESWLEPPGRRSWCGCLSGRGKKAEPKTSGTDPNPSFSLRRWWPGLREVTQSYKCCELLQILYLSKETGAFKLSFYALALGSIKSSYFLHFCFSSRYP